MFSSQNFFNSTWSFEFCSRSSSTLDLKSLFSSISQSTSSL